MALAIIFVICATAVFITVVITNANKAIRMDESYWKLKYEADHERSTNLIDLNQRILENTKEVIETNSELLKLLKQDVEEKEDVWINKTILDQDQP